MSLPSVTISGPWDQVFHESVRRELEAALLSYFRKCQWFAGKASTLHEVVLLDWLPLHAGGKSLCSDEKRPGIRVEWIGPLLVQVRQRDGDFEVYMVPIECIRGEHADGIFTIVRDDIGTTATVCDATLHAELWQRLLAMIQSRHRMDGASGHATPWQATIFGDLIKAFAISPPIVHPHKGEQTNSSATIGGRIHAKLYRRLAPGENPELEIGRYLTEIAKFSNVPAIAGAIDYHHESGECYTLAILHEAMASEGDAWTWTLEELDWFQWGVPRFLPPPNPADEDVPPAVRELIGDYLTRIERLGERTAELHLALAASNETALAPEPFDISYQQSLYESICKRAQATLALLRRQRDVLPAAIQSQADPILETPDLPVRLFRPLMDAPIVAQRIRCHGDYHLGQVLFTGDDFVIIDFEGEPDRPFSERRDKSSPLRDVAGMVRSLHYASRVARAERHEVNPMWLDAWYTWASSTFVRAYLTIAERGDFLPKNREQTRELLHAYIVEKAFYELSYELNHRPDWVHIPLDALKRIMT